MSAITFTAEGYNNPEYFPNLVALNSSKSIVGFIGGGNLNVVPDENIILHVNILGREIKYTYSTNPVGLQYTYSTTAQAPYFTPPYFSASFKINSTGDPNPNAFFPVVNSGLNSVKVWFEDRAGRYTSSSVLNLIVMVSDDSLSLHFCSVTPPDDRPILSDPIISLAGQTLSISQPEEASVYYTTDGSIPFINEDLIGGTLYSGPFSLNSASIIKAIATDPTGTYRDSSVVIYDAEPTPSESSGPFVVKNIEQLPTENLNLNSKLLIENEESLYAGTFKDLLSSISYFSSPIFHPLYKGPQSLLTKPSLIAGTLDGNSISVKVSEGVYYFPDLNSSGMGLLTTYPSGISSFKVLSYMGEIPYGFAETGLYKLNTDTLSWELESNLVTTTSPDVGQVGIAIGTKFLWGESDNPQIYDTTTKQVSSLPKVDSEGTQMVYNVKGVDYENRLYVMVQTGADGSFSDQTSMGDLYKFYCFPDESLTSPQLCNLPKNFFSSPFYGVSKNTAGEYIFPGLFVENGVVPSGSIYTAPLYLAVSKDGINFNKLIKTNLSNIDYLVNLLEGMFPCLVPGNKYTLDLLTPRVIFDDGTLGPQFNVNKDSISLKGNYVKGKLFLETPSNNGYEGMVYIEY